MKKRIGKFILAPIAALTLTSCIFDIKVDGKVKVTYQNYDGTVLHVDEIEMGANSSYSGNVPVKPSSSSAQNIFIGWDKSLNEIKRNTTVTAQYKTIDKWIDKDHDGMPEGIDPIDDLSKDPNSNYFEVGAKSFVYLDTNIRINFNKFLQTDANKTYDNDIAKLGLFLSNPKIDFKDGLFTDKAYGGRENALYSRLGCDDFHLFNFKQNDFEFDKNDFALGVMAHKYLYDDDGNILKDLIILEFGGTSGRHGWYSNFDIGYDDEKGNMDYYDKTGGRDAHPGWKEKNYHKGFYVAARRILDKNGPVKFLDYIDKHSTKSNGEPIIFVTGHSRGGALAMLVGAYLEQTYGKDEETEGKKCIPFTYAFASPNMIDNSKEITKPDTVFSILNSDDIVTMVPHKEWGFQSLCKEENEYSVSVNEKYKDEYNKNRDKREYAVIANGSEIISSIGCERSKIYNIDVNDDTRYSSVLDSKYERYTDDEIKKMYEEYKSILGNEFCGYFKLIQEEKETLLKTKYYVIYAVSCFGIIPKLIQDIMTGVPEIINNSLVWLPLVLNAKNTTFVVEVLLGLLDGGTDAVALPHDYGAYHIILREYKESK